MSDEVDFAGGTVGLYAEAEADQGVEEPVRVVAEEGVVYGGEAVGEGGDDEGAVGDALGAGDAHLGVGRTVEGSYLYLVGELAPHVLDAEVGSRRAHYRPHAESPSSSARLRGR